MYNQIFTTAVEPDQTPTRSHTFKVTIEFLIPISYSEAAKILSRYLAQICDKESFRNQDEV